MKTVLCIVAFVLSCHLNSIAQHLNSLKTALQQDISDQKKVEILNKLAQKLSRRNIEESEKYAMKALYLAEKIKKPLGRANAYRCLGYIQAKKGEVDRATASYFQALEIYKNRLKHPKTALCLKLIGQVYYNQNKYDQARQYWSESLQLYQKIKDEVGVGNLTRKFGLIYWSMGQLDKATTQYKRALTIQGKTRDEKGRGYSLNNLGLVAYERGDYVQALRYYEKSLRIAEKIADTLDIATVLNNMALVYTEQGQNAKALELYQQILSIYQKMHSISDIGDVLGNVGLVYYEQGFYKKAIEKFEAALKIQRKKNKLEFVVNALYNSGLAYKALKKYDKAIPRFLEAYTISQKISFNEAIARSLIAIGGILTIQKQYKHAEDTLHSALNIAEQMRAKAVLEQNYKALAVLDSSRSNFRQGWEFYKKYIAVRDSMFNEEKTKQLLEIQTRYETRKKEQAIKIKNKQIALLKKEKEHEQLLKYTFISSFISIGVIGGLVIMLLRLKVRKNKQLIIQNEQLYEMEKNFTQAKLTKEKLLAENLQRELDLKKQQLTSKALHIVQKNEMLEKIQTNLEQVRRKKKSETGELLQLSRMVDSSLNVDRDWDNFFGLFTEIHQGFFKNLKAQGKTLSDSELRLCALIKLKFTSKEIASILGITHGSTSVARYRIRKKLAIPKQIKLADFLSSL